MKNVTTTKFFALALATLIASGLFAQSGFDGNSLSGFLGKAASSSELKDLETNYHCEMANETHYLSKDGIELLFKNGALNEIHLFNKSAVYGSFTAKLPSGLKFGMSSGEVKGLLGKPTASYNSGYCEFELQNCMVSCWFEGGRLNQVGLAVK